MISILKQCIFIKFFFIYLEYKKIYIYRDQYIYLLFVLYFGNNKQKTQTSMVRYPSYSALVNSNASTNDQVPSLVSNKATASTLNSADSNDNGEDSLKDKADTMPTPSSSSSSSSSSATTSSSSSELIASPIYTNSTYICIITDLTDASNTCKRHAINLSSNLLIDSLIKEAANFFSYDPYSFNLMWKFNDELVCILFLFVQLLFFIFLSHDPKLDL